MDAATDYYAILGVLPTAEDIVIRAAYRALAQRYHPDHFDGSPEAAHTRMAELNAAYSVLSDPARRREYDAARGTGARNAEDALRADDSDPMPEYDPLAKDWSIALRYYPELALLEARLARIAWRLAYAYRVLLLETKRFEQGTKAAQLIEQGFLESYFGKDDQILRFARKLIEEGNKAAARMLNEAVRVLGSDADPKRLIDEIERSFAKPPPSTHANLMSLFGISYNGEQWLYQSYRYDKFEDALAYARRTHRR